MTQARASSLVGRDGEVAALTAAAEEARAGRPRCVVVTGEAGIGKTSLAIAEHWHHGGDVPRSVTAADTAVPVARRISDANRRVTLWLRIVEGWDRSEPASPVGRLSLRQAIGEAFRGPRIGVRDDLSARFSAAVGRHQTLATKAHGTDNEEMGVVMVVIAEVLMGCCRPCASPRASA